MNKTKQFWSLFKFQTTVNPFIIFMPLMFAMPLYIKYITGSFGHDYHPSLDLLLSNQNLLFVGFIGVLLLAPEVVQSGAANAMWSSGTEFLLTRAVDRHLLFRARVAFFYLLILTIPFATLLAALKNSDLQIDEYHKISHQAVLSQIPGSIPAPDDKYGRTQEITIPNGNALVESCHLWISLITAMGTQVLIFLIYPLKYRRFIFWAIYLGVIFIPLLSLRNSTSRDEKLSSDEIFFFSFVAHQPLFWFLTALALILGQLWCERRFARLEQ
jgi:hypothetical protein